MPQDYYDQLARYYRLIYPDWEASVRQQARRLDGVIQDLVGPGTWSILDAACGIGTQSIGLAEMGYDVTASDISAAELALAREEAAARGLEIAFRQADMRGVWEAHGRSFDVVMAVDNAVPHLPGDEEILTAFRQFLACTRPGGGCIISVRDYAEMARESPTFYPRRVHETADGHIILFDVWTFEDEFQEMTTYVVEDRGGAEVTTQAVRGGRYYCVTIARLMELMAEAGFMAITRLDGRFFQPLVVGKRPSPS